MNNSLLNLFFATFTGSFVYLITGFLVFDLLLGSYTETHTTQLDGFKKTTDFSVLFLYLSCLSYSLIVNLILYFSRLSSVLHAFIFSAIVGALIASMTDFYWYASSYFYSDFTVVLLDIIGAAVSVGALGYFGYTVQQLNQKA